MAESQLAPHGCDVAELKDAEVIAIAKDAYENRFGKVDPRSLRADVKDVDCDYVVIFRLVPPRPEGTTSVRVDRKSKRASFRPDVPPPPR
jgi:hypothetical protein